ncbi:hypothetical protein FRB90_007298 [Tulasnella sp. 427]|nr:hypothetical protein FRB90_007298 [Tulasnella sp. 427]
MSPPTDSIDNFGGGHQEPNPTVSLPAEPQPALSISPAPPAPVHNPSGHIEMGRIPQSGLSRAPIGSLGRSEHNSAHASSSSTPTAAVPGEGTVSPKTTRKVPLVRWTLDVLRAPLKAGRAMVNTGGAANEVSTPAPSVDVLDRVEMGEQIAPVSRAAVGGTHHGPLPRGGRNDSERATRPTQSAVGTSPVPKYTERYVPDDGDKTMAEYLWTYGFFFPPLWIAGASYLKVRLDPKWNPKLEEIDHRHRAEAKRVFREREKKYAMRCLISLVVTLLVAAALIEGLIFGLRGK